MNDSELGRLLRARNPWWRAHQWARDDDYLREVRGAPFTYRPGVLADVAAPGLYTLRGPRRVGKSVEVKRTVAQLIEAGVEPRAIVYCACNGFDTRDLRRLFRVGRSLTRGIEGPRYWLLDEITAVAGGWSAVIKDLRDETPVRNDCVVLTGSSAHGLRDAEKDLAGRRGGVPRSNRLLLPMDFRAFCAAVGDVTAPALEPLRPQDLMSTEGRDALNELSFWANELAEAWELFLDVGGFPRAVRDFRDHGDVRADFVEDMWAVVRDDAIRSSVSEPEALAFLSRIAESVATPLNATGVARDVGLGSHHRVNDRIAALSATFLTWRCYRAVCGRPNTKAFRKVYFIDPLLAALAQLRNPRLHRPDNTKLSEQQLGLAFARAVERERPGSFVDAGGVMYERTSSDAEIDFVAEDFDLALESKYVDAGWKRQAQTLQARYQSGVVATRSILDLEQHVWAVPAGIVAWAIGTSTQAPDTTGGGPRHAGRG